MSIAATIAPSATKASTIAAAPPRLKLIASYGAGVNHIDLAAAKAKGIAVTNTGHAHPRVAAAIAFALTLLRFLRVPTFVRYVRLRRKAADGEVLSLFDASRDDDRETWQQEIRFASDDSALLLRRIELLRSLVVRGVVALACDIGEVAVQVTVAFGFHKNVGQDRNRVPPLNHGLNVGQRPHQRIAVDGQFHVARFLSVGLPQRVRPATPANGKDGPEH